METLAGASLDVDCSHAYTLSNMERILSEIRIQQAIIETATIGFDAESFEAAEIKREDVIMPAFARVGMLMKELITTRATSDADRTAKALATMLVSDDPLARSWAADILH
jgi:hypothetical protein